jgi:Uma2 family endonuclease
MNLSSTGLQEMPMTVLMPAETLSPTPPPTEVLYEIVDGQYKELPPMSAEATLLAARLFRKLVVFLELHDLGEAVPELLCGLKPGARRKYRPDLAFVSYKRWPKDRPWPSTDPMLVVPDLAVEVVSPNDIAEDVQAKVKAYLEAGVQLVWVIYPPLGWMVVFEPQGRCRYLTTADELDGGSVLPGFRLPLRELFTQSAANGSAAAPEASA